MSKNISTIQMFCIFIVICIFAAWLDSSIDVVAQSEVVTSFDADIVVENDGDLVVTETIVYDFQNNSRHGIVRNIKNKHAERASVWYKEKYIDFEVVSVSKDGKTEPYIFESSDGLQLKIGNPNLNITGSHTYIIKYYVKGALSHNEAGTELYWNVTGNEWLVDILETSATIKQDGKGVLPASQSCYVGLAGTSVPCQDKKLLTNTALFKGGLIKPGEEFTVAQALTLPTTPQVLERMNWGLIKFLAVIFWFVLLTYFVFRWRFRYRFTESIIAQYEPLQYFKPMFTGVLIDGRVDSRDISAGIIYLAQRGYISIEQVEEGSILSFKESDYKITLLRPMNEVESDLDRSLLELFFNEDHSTSTGLAKPAVLLSGIERKKEDKTTFRVKVLKARLTDELINLGLFERGLKRGLMTILLILITSGIYLMQDPSELLYISEHVWFYVVLISVVLLTVFATERRTREGYEVLNYLKGFKLFLTVTEKDRYKILNAPALRPQQFMEYLPYAIAFGVEEEWATVFKDMQIDNPVWYSSRTLSSKFNTQLFTSSLVSFSSNLTSSLRSNTGSKGRGFSGGGSGGGGGRSW